MFEPDAEIKQAVLNHIEQSEDRIVDTLRQLIRFRTVNPPGNEREHQEFVAAELRDLGLAPQLIEALPGRPNIIAMWSGEDDGPTFLHYAGHADVVDEGDPAEWRYPAFGGEVHDGWIWGRGAVDHKAPIAASLAAVRAIMESGVRLSGNVLFLVPVDEERGSRVGTRYLLEKGLLYGEMGLYGSAGFLEKVLINCSGTVTFEITVHGQASHSGYPAAGINAVAQASKLVLALQNLTFDKINPSWRPDHTDRLSPSRTGSLTISGIYGGGPAFNVVPDRCVVRGSRRLIPIETPAEAKAQIEALLTSLATDDPHFKAEVNFIDAVPGINTPADAPLVQLVEGAVRDIGLEPVLDGCSGGFDARWIVQALGIPMVSYGAGWNGPDGNLCLHTPNECISIENLIGMAKGFAMILLRACGVAH